MLIAADLTNGKYLKSISILHAQEGLAQHVSSVQLSDLLAVIGSGTMDQGSMFGRVRGTVANTSPSSAWP
jgi:hypothetical protein